MWMIDKQFSFCYGHRVWSQKLENEFCESGDYKCKCRALHGHEGLVHVFLEGDELERGMVTDFKHLGWLKNFLDKQIDHKFIIDRHDPLYAFVTRHMMLEEVYVPDTEHVAGYVLNTDALDPESPEFEYLDGIFVVDFVPTSENLSKWIFDCANAKMKKLGIKVSRVDWFETPKSRSTYIGN